MRKVKREKARAIQPEQTQRGEEDFLKEEIKKSSVNAKDSYDYKKLCVRRQGLIPCRYEEDREDLYFYYQIKGMTPFAAIKNEDREKKYQILINFARLAELHSDYVLRLNEDNLYYDENGLVYVKERDIYGRGERPDNEYFLNSYKCFVAGILGSRYSVSQIQESGIEICKGEKWFEPVYICSTPEEIADVLRGVRGQYVSEQRSQMQKVKKATYSVWRFTAVFAAAAALVCGGYAGYLSLKTVPEQRHLLTASQAFIQKDYRTCVETLREMEPEEMDVNTLYILAYAYANMESFRQDEIRTIIENISVSSNRKILEYWIRIGRLETKKAEEIALSLSDDKLLIYAYMKEADDLENNTEIEGTEKKNRLDELESQIEKLGDKYEEQDAGNTGSSVNEAQKEDAGETVQDGE